MAYDWEEIKSYLNDISRFPEFCERFLKIIPKAGKQKIPFKLNTIQKWYFETYYKPQYLAGLPIRDCVLKARQFGFTTLFSALNYWGAIGHSAWEAIAVGREIDQSQEIFRKYRRFDESLIETDFFPEFPKTGDSRNVIEYNKPTSTYKGQTYEKDEDGMWYNRHTGKPCVFLDSRIVVKSGEQKGSLGRSGTYHAVHASELAFWPDCKSALIAILQCAHALPQTAVFLETTANGMNAFYSWWQNLESFDDDEVDVLWRKIFVPWYWEKDYEISAEGKKREFKDDEEEAQFYLILNDKRLKKIDATAQMPDRIWAKLFWRRWCIINNCGRDEDFFKQEYPATPAEAFMFTGRSVFPPTVMAWHEKQTSEPKWRGNVGLKYPKKADKKTGIPPSKFFRKPDPRGRLSVWEMPKRHEMYSVFADVAEGKAVESADTLSKFDFSAVAVVRVSSWPKMRLVSSWHGNCDPDEFGHVLVAIGTMYNYALLGWEVNGPGRSLKMQIVNQHRYKNIYLRESQDNLTGEIMLKPGWLTTRITKQELVAVAQRFIRKREVIIPDDKTISELKVYSQYESKFGAASGHDDRVMALMGALRIAERHVISMKRKAEASKQKAIDEKKAKDRIDAFDDLPNGEECWNPYLGSEY